VLFRSAAAAPAAAATSGLAGNSDEGDLFDLLMACAEAPGAEDAGLTGELVCQYQEVLDALPPPARASKVRCLHLRAFGRAGAEGVRLSAWHNAVARAACPLCGPKLSRMCCRRSACGSSWLHRRLAMQWL